MADNTKLNQLEDTLTALQNMSSRDVLIGASAPVEQKQAVQQMARQDAATGTYSAETQPSNWWDQITGNAQATDRNYNLTNMADQRVAQNRQARLYELMLHPAYSDPFHPGHEAAQAAVQQHLESNVWPGSY